MKRGVSVGDFTPPFVKMMPAKVRNSNIAFNFTLNNLYFSNLGTS
jgi:hypothetical protein